MQKPKTIVVPTDFSDLSKLALPHARAIAEEWGAEIVLVYVVPPEQYPTHHVVRVAGFPNLAEEMRKAGRARLQQVAGEIGGTVPVSVECREGRVFQEVEAVATARGAGLIVLATHGYGGIKHAVLGSKAERIVRTSVIPVLSVRADDSRPALVPSGVRRILLPTDYSATSRDALRAAAWFCSPDTELFVVHVFEPPMYPNSPFGLLPIDVGEIERDMRAAAETRMKEWMEELRKEHPTARGTVVEGTPAEQLVRVAEEQKVDLVAIATHGHTGLKHVYLGSVAEHVVRRSGPPVLTVRSE